MSNYKLGTSDPKPGHDAGSGAWNSESTELSTHAKKAALLQVLPMAYAYPGPNATRHMYHYMGNTGSDLTIDLENMVKVVPSARVNLAKEIEEAKRFIETQPEGVYSFCSEASSGGYNLQAENADWFFANGGYSFWGKGVAVVAYTKDFLKAYQMVFQFKFYDRYNWDGGKQVYILRQKITDEELQVFHRQGVAKEFDCFGQIERAVKWGAPMPVNPSPAPVGPVNPPQPPPPKPTVPPTNPLPTPTIPKPVVPQPPIAPKPTTPVVPPKPSTTIHVVKPGENLSWISKKYYGTTEKWPKIYDVNKVLIGSNPNLIRPGQNLVIPAI